MSAIVRRFRVNTASSRCCNNATNYGSSKRFSSSNATPFTRPKTNTTSSTTSSTSTAEESKNKLLFYRLSRVARVCFITVGIYQLGYSQGCIDYGKNPEIMQMQLIDAQLKTNEAKNVYHPSSSIYQRVDPIFHRIIESARSYVDSKIKTNGNRILEIDKEIKASKEQDDSKIGQLKDLIGEKTILNAELAELKEAQNQLSGNWKLCLSDSKIPNAYVNETIPRVIFVNEGLLTYFKPTDDELALILGHEISHMILHHSTNKLFVQIGLSVSQLIIYTFIDPVGYSSFMIDGAMETLTNYFTMAYSRQCECEADNLGIAITARACYDTAEGSKIFKKFNEVSNNHRTSFAKTHPGDLDRYEKLTEMSKNENWNTYTNCKSLRNSWMQIRIL